MRDLIWSAIRGQPQVGLRCFISDNSTNDFRIRTLWTWLAFPFWRKQLPIFPPHQSAMKLKNVAGERLRPSEVGEA
jgi:hypothetical protein